MNIHTEISAWLKIRNSLGMKSIGFVHTMGNLHDGHMSLCVNAKKENEITVVAIFVNPKQFNDAKDYESYPRTLEKDIALLKLWGIDHLLLFNNEALYPDKYDIRVIEKNLSYQLEGSFRPGHFDGMLTIVLKFLNLVKPTHAYYGEKDFQQLLLIEKMCHALFLPTKIVRCETVREANGLAYSSRNERLTPEDKNKAANLARLLHSQLTIDDIIDSLQQLGFTVDYVVELGKRRLAAVWLSGVRLIDNVVI